MRERVRSGGQRRDCRAMIVLEIRGRPTGARRTRMGNGMRNRNRCRRGRRGRRNRNWGGEWGLNIMMDRNGQNAVREKIQRRTWWRGAKGKDCFMEDNVPRDVSCISD